MEKCENGGGGNAKRYHALSSAFCTLVTFIVELRLFSQPTRTQSENCYAIKSANVAQAGLENGKRAKRAKRKRRL